MIKKLDPKTIIESAYSIAVGAIGALIGFFLSLPLYPLLAPALLVSGLSLAGFKFQVPPLLRNIAFILIGINVGVAVTPDVVQTVARWPVAFIVLAIALYMIVIVGRWMLVRFFGFDQKTAMLSSMPGHLSFAISFGTAVDADTTKIMIVQTIRLLALTLAVPLIAQLLGVQLGDFFIEANALMSIYEFAALALASVLLGFLFIKLKVPAPFLLSPMLLSSLAHLSQIIEGGIHISLFIAPLIVLGTTIGSRFVGQSLKELKKIFLAGIASTLIAVICASLAAFTVAGFLSMPLAHVFVAFAPGGLETMIIMGAVLGANPAFVTASHIVRLFILAVAMPILMRRL